MQSKFFWTENARTSLALLSPFSRLWQTLGKPKGFAWTCEGYA